MLEMQVTAGGADSTPLPLAPAGRSPAAACPPQLQARWAVAQSVPLPSGRALQLSLPGPHNHLACHRVLAAIPACSLQPLGAPHRAQRRTCTLAVSCIRVRSAASRISYTCCAAQFLSTSSSLACCPAAFSISLSRPSSADRCASALEGMRNKAERLAPGPHSPISSSLGCVGCSL